MAAVTFALAACSSNPMPALDRLYAVEPQLTTRHIEVEVADLQTGLPCAVIDRSDTDGRRILWRADYDPGFCQRKAEETRQRLRDRGWACRRIGIRERQGLIQASETGSSERPYLTAVWSCINGRQPTPAAIAVAPPVPSAKPDLPPDRSTSWGDERLRQAVQDDLATIGQDAIDLETAVDAALGDLNGDGVEDAAVVLTRKASSGTPHRLLMAYLQSNDAYTLVDVWILDKPSGAGDERFRLAIEDGLVRLEDCCGAGRDPTVLVLEDRKLTYARGS